MMSTRSTTLHLTFSSAFFRPSSPLIPFPLSLHALQNAGSRRSRRSAWLAASSPEEASGPGSQPSGCTDPRRRCSGAEDPSSQSSTSSPPLTAPRTRGERRELRVSCGEISEGFPVRRDISCCYCVQVDFLVSLLCQSLVLSPFVLWLCIPAFLLLLLSCFIFTPQHRDLSIHCLTLLLIKTAINHNHYNNSKARLFDPVNCMHISVGKAFWYSHLRRSLSYLKNNYLTVVTDKNRAVNEASIFSIVKQTSTLYRVFETEF